MKIEPIDIIESESAAIGGAISGSSEDASSSSSCSSGGFSSDCGSIIMSTTIGGGGGVGSSTAGENTSLADLDSLTDLLQIPTDFKMDVDDIPPSLVSRVQADEDSNGCTSAGHAFAIDETAASNNTAAAADNFNNSQQQLLLQPEFVLQQQQQQTANISDDDDEDEDDEPRINVSHLAFPTGEEVNRMLHTIGIPSDWEDYSFTNLFPKL